MEIGNGLTLHTVTVGNKTTSGIYLMKNDKGDSKKKSSQNLIKKNVSNSKVSKDKTSKNFDIKFQNKLPGNSVSNRLKENISKPQSRKTCKKSPAITAANYNNSNNKVKVSRPNSEQKIQIDPKYITLTQDQLNTILSLVKTKQEIDISNVLSSNNQEDLPELSSSSLNKDKEDAGCDKDGDVSDEVVVLKLLENEEENTEEIKTKNIEKTKDEEVKLPEQVYTFSGTLLGLGSREKEKERLERERKQWIEDLKNQVKKNKEAKQDTKVSNLKAENHLYFGDKVSNKNENNIGKLETSTTDEIRDDKLRKEENLPSAIRSSFLIGESAPRTHAFSAKKRQDQEQWRRDLEKQIKEQKMKKKQSEEVQGVDDDWNRHFETMQPQPTSRSQTPRSNSEIKDEVDPDKDKYQYYENIHGSTSPVNHLRKMTSLLDPAEKDAMRIRRQKQQEHRRAIAEQMEEKRRMKEREEEMRRQEEEEEDRRLRKDRINLQKQSELEKLSQQEKEELRQKQVCDLYQQMQQAQVEAEREKYEKKHEALRRKGHDTSRLERTNRKQHPLVTEMPTSESRITSQLPVKTEIVASPSRMLETTVISNTPRFTSLTTNPDNPIRLEISLNQSPNSLNGTKEISVQTDMKQYLPVSHFPDDDSLFSADTEYIPLPLPKSQKMKRQSKPRLILQENQKQSDNEDVYEKYERQKTVRKAHLTSKERPKWGVGGYKKEYKSASQKYVKGMYKREKRVFNKEKNEEKPLNEISKPSADLLNKLNKKDISMRSTKKSKPQTNKEARFYEQERMLEGRRSPPIPALRHRQHNEDVRLKNDELDQAGQRPMSVTTYEAKYAGDKHSNVSPVPFQTSDFVEYLRSEEVVFKPTTPLESDKYLLDATNISTSSAFKPVVSDVAKQRQDQILKEISILRQGLLLKQREVASFPTVVADDQKKRH